MSAVEEIFNITLFLWGVIVWFVVCFAIPIWLILSWLHRRQERG